MNSTARGANYTNESIADGNYLAKFACNDTNNNFNSTEQVNFTIDLSPPYFDHAITNSSAEFNTAFFVNLNASDAREFSCFSVNDSANFTINCSGYLKNKTVLETGIYWLNVSINDTLNNLNSSVFMVNVTDSVFPTVTIVSPENITYVGNFSLVYNVSTSENSTCYFSLDNFETNVSMSQINSLSYRYINGSLSSGAFVINFSCNDTHNNLNMSEGIFFSIDNSVPMVSLVSPSELYTATSSSVSFVYNLTSSLSANCSLYLDGVNTAFNSTPNNTGLNNSFSASLAEGTYSWFVSCRDSSNYLTNSSIRTLMIDLPSTGGGGGTGGGTTTPVVCSDECSVLSESICSDSLTLRTRYCGNYDSDDCLEWSGWNSQTCAETCLVDQCTDICDESWSCGTWSVCSLGVQTRVCTDTNYCGTNLSKPVTSQSCIENVSIYYSPSLENIVISPGSTVPFQVGVSSNTEVTIRWFVDSAPYGVGYNSTGAGLSMSFSSNSNVRVDVSYGGISFSHSWNIFMNNSPVEVCESDWYCDWSICQAGDSYSYAENCVDLEDCEVPTVSTIPFREECDCISEIECSEFGGCYPEYTIFDILENQVSTNFFKTRTCTDLYNCVEDYEEYEACSLSSPVVIEKLSASSGGGGGGGETSLVIKDATSANVLGIVTLTDSSVDISLQTTEAKLHCSDKNINYDEEAVDCGGEDCVECTSIQEVSNWAKYLSVLLWTLLSLIVLFFFIFGGIQKMHFFGKNHLKKSSFLDNLKLRYTSSDSFSSR